MIIDQRLVELILIINDLGHQALIVGGAVRNHLLNIKITDYDLATSANIKDLSQVFLNSSIIYRQKKAFALKITYKGFKCEVSTFRIEEDYQNRLPKKITYVDSYKDDYLRRDFTINALAYSLDGRIIDYCNGLKDLENKLVRSIRNPKESFLEDEMRILRGLRLAATLDFTVEEKTLKAMQDLYKKVLDLSLDLVSGELKQIIGGSNFDYVYNNFQDLFSDISDNQFKNIPVGRRKVLNSDDILYIYLNDVLGLCESNPIYNYLDFSKAHINKVHGVKDLLNKLKTSLEFKEMQVLQIDYGKDKLTYSLTSLSKLDLLPKENLGHYNRIIKGEVFKISDLKISEKDLDFVTSVKTRYKILTSLQRLVVLDKVKNLRPQLLEKAQELFNKEKD